MSTQKLESLVQRLEAVAAKLESTAGGKPAKKSASSGGVSEAVTAFDEYFTASVKPFLVLSRKIGGDLDEMTNIVEKLFTELRKVVNVASQSQKPAMEGYVALIKPLQELCAQAADYRNSKRRTVYFNHLSGLADGIKLVLWVGVPNTPKPYVDDMVEAARFYHIKVLVEYKKKEGGDLHKNWVNAFKTLGTDLAAYVKEYHTTGLKFNPKGGDIGSAKDTPKVEKKVQKVGASKGKGNLFAAINKGGNVTSGLKHVKKSQKTKYQTGPKPKIKFKAKAKKSRITRKPVTELVRNSKWAVENHDGNKNLVVEADLKHTVYVYKCDNCNVVVKGKCNSVTLDDCRKTNLVFDSLVSSCELVNCRSVKVQVLGTLPTLLCDKTDGFNVFLNEKTLDTTIVTSKSSEMNISVPAGNNDYKEAPIPEQFVTTYNKETGKFKTQVSSHF